MANNTISQVEINGTTYDLLDANTLNKLSDLEETVTQLQDSVDQYRGVLDDMSYSALLSVKPGIYVATGVTANRPTSTYAHVFVHPLPAGMDRVFAIAVFDNSTF